MFTVSEIDSVELNRDGFWAWELLLRYHTLYYKEMLGTSKNKDISLGNFVPNSGLTISPRQVNRVANKTYQRSSLLTTLTTVDTSSLDTGLPHVHQLGQLSLASLR